MCDMHGVQFAHHRAGNDAEAAAKLVLCASRKAGVTNVDDLLKQSKLKCGGLSRKSIGLREGR